MSWIIPFLVMVAAILTAISAFLAAVWGSPGGSVLLEVAAELSALC